MAADAGLAAALPEDEFEVRIFTIADHAEAVSESGKLYINGAGVGTIWIRTVPGPLAALYIALRLKVPWQNLTEPFELRIRALNPDRSPVGPDPIFEVKPEMGRPPGLRPGDEAAVNAAFSLGGLEIQAYGTIYFHLEVEGETLARLPLKVAPLQGASVRPTS